MDGGGIPQLEDAHAVAVGLLDDVPTEKIQAFEKALFDYYDRDFALLGAKLRDPKDGDQALPELWLMDEAELPQAERLLHELRHPRERRWRCTGCGEVTERLHARVPVSKEGGA